MCNCLLTIHHINLICDNISVFCLQLVSVVAKEINYSLRFLTDTHFCVPKGTEVQYVLVSLSSRNTTKHKWEICIFGYLVIGTGRLPEL